MFGLSYAAVVLWFLGYPDQALKKSFEALALARELSHPISLIAALDLVAWFHQLLREGQVTQEQIRMAISLSVSKGFHSGRHGELSYTAGC